MLKLDAKLTDLGLQPGEVYKEYFVFYRSFAEVLRNLPDNYKISLLNAMIDFGLDMKEPDFCGDGVLIALWSAIAPQMESNWVKTLNGYKGKDYGVKGGAPIGNQNARKSKTTPKQPQTTPKEKESIKEKEKEKEKESAKAKDATAGPGREEVVDFCISLGLAEDHAIEFYDKFNDANWIDRDGRKIQDWKALARAWAKNCHNDYPPNPPKPPKPPKQAPDYDEDKYLAENVLRKLGIDC